MAAVAETETMIAERSGNAMHRLTYDAKGNVVTVTNPLQQTSRVDCNSFGQTTRVRDPLLNPTLFDYDLQGNLITATDALNHATQRRYDAVSRLIELTDARGKLTKFTYDTLNREEIKGVGSLCLGKSKGRRWKSIPSDGLSLLRNLIESSA